MARTKNAELRYFNFLNELYSQKKEFDIKKFIKQFTISNSVTAILKERKIIEPRRNGRSVNFVYKGTIPTREMANDVIFYVNKKVKDYQNKSENTKSQRTLKSLLFKSENLFKKTEELVKTEVKTESFVLTDEMCIQHLKNSKEFTYEIYKISKQML